MTILKGNADLVPAQHVTYQQAVPRTLACVLAEQRQAITAGDIDTARTCAEEIIAIIEKKRGVTCA